MDDDPTAGAPLPRAVRRAVGDPGGHGRRGARRGRPGRRAARRAGGVPVLDAGCGTGRVAIELARRGYETVGVDVDPDLLARARDKAPDAHVDRGRPGHPAGRRRRRGPFAAAVLAGNVMIFVARGHRGRGARQPRRPARARRARRRRLPAVGATHRRRVRRPRDRGRARRRVERWSTWDRAPFNDAGDYVVAVDLEAVAHPGLGEEVARAAGLGLELAPHVRHVHAQVGGLVVVLRAPHLLQQLPLRHELALVAHQDLDQVPLGRRESHLGAGAVHPLRAEIDGEVRRLDHGLLLGRRRAPQRGAQTSQQLVHAERLGHVVVGPGVERRHLVVLGVAHRQHDDRDTCSTRGGPGSPRRRRCPGSPRSRITTSGWWLAASVSACSPSGARSTS